jgi:hypothetical protein
VSGLVTFVMVVGLVWLLVMWVRSIDRAPVRPGPWHEGPSRHPLAQCPWVDEQGVRCAYSASHVAKRNWPHDNPFVKP